MKRTITVTWSPDDRHRSTVRVLALSVIVAALVSLVPRSADVPHRVIHGMGLMAPTCGLTRASWALLRLDLPRAVYFNPAVVPLAAAAVVILLREVVGRVAGTWLTVGSIPRWTCWWAAVGVVALAAWQQTHFNRLALS